MLLGIGKIKDLAAYKAETRPRGSNASWQMAQIVTIWFMVMVFSGRVEFSDAPQFLLMQTAIIAPWMKYSFSRHINKHRTNQLNLEQDKLEVRHNVDLEEAVN